jgi:nucleoside-diphosphate-sugar epimerase
MTILVTGASGFLGRHLVEKLLLREYVVRTLSRSRGENLPADVQHTQGDIKEVPLLEAAMAGVHTVYHAAAVVPDSGSDTEMWETNVTGTRSVAQACLRAGVRRLVLVSSIAVYKAPLADLVSESAPVGGGTTYGRSKAEAESFATDICRGRMELVIGRPCKIFGTNDRTGFTRKLLRLVKSPVLPVAGSQGRSFSLIHVSDVADGLCAAGERKGIDGAIVNLASKTRTSLLELAASYSRLVGKKTRGIKFPIPESILRAAMSFRWAAKNFSQARRDSLFGDYGPRSTHGSVLLGGPLYDIQTAISLLDFSPRITYEQGLLEVIGEEAVKRGSISRETSDRVAMTRP